MTIKIQRFFNIAMILLSWLTIPRLGIDNIRRFFPASMLILFVETIFAKIGKKQRWWVFYNKPKSFLFGEFPYQIGPFLAISMWFLKWTYGNFKWFILLNGIGNAMFAYPYSYLARKFRYYTLVRFNHSQFFVYFFYKAFFLYGFQYLFEKMINQKNGNIL
ncbi:hypothetical protein [Bacillus sp. J33]|uniref:hypothetical protein n=1 Tax=Bacillus sp. J33 TaxID=935836 RepID=UPI00047D73AE|nr:hypothetical protein [Bacillus sp. J33]